MSLEVLLGAGVLAAMLRLATPIALAALGGVISERSGVTISSVILVGSATQAAFMLRPFSTASSIVPTM